MPTLKIECYHDANFVVTGGDRYDNPHDDKVGIMQTLGFQCIHKSYDVSCWQTYTTRMH